jgi:hypothetical protein
MSGRHDARQLKKQLEQEGFTVRETGSGHYEVRYEGRRVTTFPQTPSDCRWRLNTLGNIKRWKRNRGMNGKP